MPVHRYSHSKQFITTHTLFRFVYCEHKQKINKETITSLPRNHILMYSATIIACSFLRRYYSVYMQSFSLYLPPPISFIKTFYACGGDACLCFPCFGCHATDKVLFFVVLHIWENGNHSQLLFDADSVRIVRMMLYE